MKKRDWPEAGKQKVPPTDQQPRKNNVGQDNKSQKNVDFARHVFRNAILEENFKYLKNS